jgi:hypothetical protein
MTHKQKLLTSFLVVGVLGGVAALGVLGLFSATTQNTGNEVTSGTVALSDNDSGAAMFNIHGAKPGDSWTRCIKVTYHGSLPADVRVYLQDAAGPLAAYLDLKITQGGQASPVFPGCTGFTPDSTGTIFEGPIDSPVPGSWDFGLPITPAGQTSWHPGDSLVFEMEMTLNPNTPDTLQASSTGTMTSVWESRNQ